MRSTQKHSGSQSKRKTLRISQSITHQNDQQKHDLISYPFDILTSIGEWNTTSRWRTRVTGWFFSDSLMNRMKQNKKKGKSLNAFDSQFESQSLEKSCGIKRSNSHSWLLSCLDQQEPWTFYGEFHENQENKKCDFKNNSTRVQLQKKKYDFVLSPTTGTHGLTTSLMMTCNHNSEVWRSLIDNLVLAQSNDLRWSNNPNSRMSWEALNHKHMNEHEHEQNKNKQKLIHS